MFGITIKTGDIERIVSRGMTIRGLVDSDGNRPELVSIHNEDEIFDMPAPEREKAMQWFYNHVLPAMGGLVGDHPDVIRVNAVWRAYSRGRNTAHMVAHATSVKEKEVYNAVRLLLSLAKEV